MDTIESQHLHWEFMAFDDFVNETGDNVKWPVLIDVIGYSTEENAKIAAQDIIQRKEFKLRRVYECNTCKYQAQISSTMKDMSDTMK